jgi:NTP pyrophosphatase (non-canonical NTP hydrolase)
MTFEEYQKGVLRTWSPDTASITPWGIECAFVEMGLSGETGEISEMLKKGIFHGQPEMLDRDKMKKELGDVYYYLNVIAHLFDIPFEEVAEANTAKLLARYPDGFVKGGGIRVGEGA